MIAHDEAASIAQAISAFRSERQAYLPKDLFGEMGWAFVLELFVGDAVGRSLTGREIADKLGSPEPVASRWLKHLSSIGLVIGDGDGDLDDQLTLSGEGFANIEALLVHARELQNNWLTLIIRTCPMIEETRPL